MSYVSYYTDDGDHEQINGERAKARKLSTLRAFYKYFYRKERIKNNPPSLVDQPSIHDKSIIRLEPDEVARLLDAVQSGEGLTEKEKQYHKRTQARDLAILTLFLGTGIRISELVGINMEDINFSANEFSVTRKGAIRHIGIRARLALPCSTTCWTGAIDACQAIGRAVLSLKKKRITVRAVKNLVHKYGVIVTHKKNIPHN